MYKLSLRIDGDIVIEAFREAIVNFITLLHEVDEAVSGGRSVRWKLADLRRESPAVLTWVGEPRKTRTKKGPVQDFSPAVGEELMEGVEKLERGLGRPRVFSDDALDATKRLAHLKMRRGITGIAIRGENADPRKGPKTIDVTERAAAAVNDLIGPRYTAPGSVEGTLQAINSHGHLYFVVYDNIWGGRVRCDIPESLKRKALDVFDQRVLVRGLVSTDAAGHPRHVKVEGIDPLPGRDRLPQSIRGLDPDYTAGFDVAEYVRKRWSGDA